MVDGTQATVWGRLVVAIFIPIAALVAQRRVLTDRCPHPARCRRFRDVHDRMLVGSDRIEHWMDQPVR